MHDFGCKCLVLESRILSQSIMSIDRISFSEEVFIELRRCGRAHDAGIMSIG